jgi:hypothetical protein
MAAWAARGATAHTSRDREWTPTPRAVRVWPRSTTLVLAATRVPQLRAVDHALNSNSCKRERCQVWWRGQRRAPVLRGRRPRSAPAQTARPSVCPFAAPLWSLARVMSVSSWSVRARAGIRRLLGLRGVGHGLCVARRPPRIPAPRSDLGGTTELGAKICDAELGATSVPMTPSCVISASSCVTLAPEAMTSSKRSKNDFKFF